MTNRVPGAPGQYKAVVVGEELQKMQTGEPFTITMTRDDQPIVEGTPYSKEAVLPDALAQSLCPNIQDPTPADAFAALSSGFISYYSCVSVDELNAKIAELTEAQPEGTEKNYELYLYWKENMPIPFGRWSVTIFKPRIGDGTKWASVTATVVSSKDIFKMRQELYEGTWLGWEWENPPMIQGVVYKTTERFCGEVVYTTVIDCGKMPNNSQKAVEHGIGMDKVIRFCGYAGTSALPFNMNSWITGNQETEAIDVSVSTTAVYLKSNFDASADSGMVQAWFTRG